jgi:hypothetical protein
MIQIWTVKLGLGVDFWYFFVDKCLRCINIKDVLR